MSGPNGTDISHNSLAFQEKGLPGHDEGVVNSFHWQGGPRWQILIKERLLAKSNLCSVGSQAPGLPFADLLPAEVILGLLEEQDVVFRDRDYPPLITLAMFLSQCCDADQSLNQAVARLMARAGASR